jgi:hypothetical protein
MLDKGVSWAGIGLFVMVVLVEIRNCDGRDDNVEAWL